MTTPDLPVDLDAQVQRALAEDIGSGDITALLIPAGKLATGRILSREAGILCGVPWAEAVFAQVSTDIEADWQLRDGEALYPDSCIATLRGPARALMSAERCALNFLQTLSASATVTADLVARVAHTRARLLDTRKTLPGLRSAQKYAVRVGGGGNHRMGLYDAFLIKENHIRACGGIKPAVDSARRQQPGRPVEVEVRDQAELQEAIAAGADTVMLDNFSLAALREAVQFNAGRVKLEASGGIEGDALVSIAETGVDYISLGALTKHVRALDLSLLLD